MIKKILILQFWLFFIFCSYLSLTSAPPEALHDYSDKLLHATGYCALFLSCHIAYRQQSSWYQRAGLLLSYSLAIEIAQHFIPHRGFSLADMLANAIGLLFGFLFSKLAEKTGLFSALGERRSTV
ncbi:MAG: VanZ family protein [Geopsychrobacter sp.]|nr:VanZ family protein [Geopsychrobacter sp.]